MKPRILITSRLNGAGGVETHLLNLCRLLVAQGAEVTLVSRCVNPETPLVRLRREVPIRLITTPFARDLRWFRLSTLWALAWWPLLLRGRHFDMFYTIEASPFTKFLARFVRPGGHVLLSRAGGLVQPTDILHPQAREVLDGMLAESEMQAEAARKVFKLNIPVVGLPLLSHTETVVPRVRYLAPGEPLCVAFLGRFDSLKGIYRLLDIWPKLNIAPAHLDFYGHGPERERLCESIRQRNLTNEVRVNGGWTHADELAEIMNATDLIVLPSETEGLPLVLLEAMSYGVPFVATEVGAVRTLAEDNPDVRVVALDNAALIQAIHEMACAIRAGQINSARLQAYHRARYGYEILAKRYVDALLFPENFWDSVVRRDADATKNDGAISNRHEVFPRN